MKNEEFATALNNSQFSTFNFQLNCFCIQSDEAVEFFWSAVFYEIVGKAEADDFRMEVVVGHVLEDCGTQSTLYDTIFYGHYPTTGRADLMQDALVDGFEETHVVMCNGNTFFSQFAHDFGNYIAEGTEREDGYSPPPTLP